jgi:hypothetical protein
MKRSASYTILGATLVGLGLLAGCGRPVHSKEELAQAMAGAMFPASAARGSGASMSLYQSGADAPDQLPRPSITVQGPNGGSAVLSVNPVGLVVGLAGKGVLFDMEYKKFSVDGLHVLKGDVSVLANFEYLAAGTDPSELNFEVGFVGDIGLGGELSDDLELNLRVKTNLAELVDRQEEMTLRLKGWVEAKEQRFEFADEDLVINWRELEERARQP